MNRKQLVVLFGPAACLVLAGPAWGQQPTKTEPPRSLPSFYADKLSVSASLDKTGEAWLLRCYHADRTCELIEAIPTGPGGRGLIHIFPQDFKVVQWDADGLVAQSDAPICVTDRLLVNFADESVTLLKSPKEPTVKPLVSCKAAKSETIKMLPEAK